METLEDFRFNAHQLVLALDAATAEMMDLISNHETTGDRWLAAVAHQHDCYEAWQAYINKPRE